jgi:hypothetical protein
MYSEDDEGWQALHVSTWSRVTRAFRRLFSRRRVRRSPAALITDGFEQRTLKRAAAATANRMKGPSLGK